MPRASDTEAMVLAVNMPAHAPWVGQALRSIRDSSSAVRAPAAWAPTASNTLTMSRASSRSRPGRIVPPYRNTDGRFRRAAAMSIPGSDLSHPAKVTSPSNRSACIIVSTESAMTSLLTSEARMPSWPMEIPSDTAIVTNSSGKPPAARTPSLALSARRSRGMLQGVTSFQDEATPTWGFSQSSSRMPTARSMARAGARSKPCVTSGLRGLGIGCSSMAASLRPPLTAGAGDCPPRPRPALPRPRAPGSLRDDRLDDRGGVGVEQAWHVRDVVLLHRDRVLGRVDAGRGQGDRDGSPVEGGVDRERSLDDATGRLLATDGRPVGPGDAVVAVGGGRVVGRGHVPGPVRALCLGDRLGLHRRVGPELLAELAGDLEVHQLHAVGQEPQQELGAVTRPVIRHQRLVLVGALRGIDGQRGLAVDRRGGGRRAPRARPRHVIGVVARRGTDLWARGARLRGGGRGRGGDRPPSGGGGRGLRALASRRAAGGRRRRARRRGPARARLDLTGRGGAVPTPAAGPDEKQGQKEEGTGRDAGGHGGATGHRVILGGAVSASPPGGLAPQPSGWSRSVSSAVASLPSARPCVAFMTWPTSAPSTLASPARKRSHSAPLAAITESTAAPSASEDSAS